MSNFRFESVDVTYLLTFAMLILMVLGAIAARTVTLRGERLERMQCTRMHGEMSEHGCVLPRVQERCR